MSEQEQRRDDSPLLSDRGRTTIADNVVAQLAGMAAQEVSGVHMGGSAARTAGGIIGSITGSEGQTRGVSVEVGATEVAVDLTMGVEYGRNMLQVVEEVRRRISERVESLTGLRVTESNVTISDIIFPEDGVQRRRSLDGGARSAPEREIEPGSSERETAAVGTSSRETRAEGEGGPLQEDETAELRPEDVSGTRRPPADDATTRRSERSE